MRDKRSKPKVIPMTCKHGVNIKVHICHDCVLADDFTVEGEKIA